MSNLENLRKQAKQILRWHRQGYVPVAQSIRSSLPRYASLTDRQVMEAELRLADAQEIVARQNGFESWHALAQGTAPMESPNSTTLEVPTLLWAEPQLFVADISRSLRFFERLGMATAFVYGEPPFYAQVVRDSARLNLRHVDESPFKPEVREQDSYLAASLVVSDVKALFLEFQANGIEFQQTLKKEPWGARTFIVKDPDGNMILFA